jgi:voltage-gated potassium channel
MKAKIYSLLHKNKTVIQFIYGLIIINIIGLILESDNSFSEEFGDIFLAIEVVSIIIFTFEYLLRLWVSDLDKEVQFNRRKFFFSTAGLIDLLAILPFYLPFIFKIDLRVIRILRLLRLIRIFKLGRFSKSLKTINEVIKETRPDLAITLFFALILLILSSTLMYYAENEAQPDKFESIAHSFWWAVATLTTVGYGDIFPITSIGKILSGVISIIGIGFIALPTGIISSAFVSKLQTKKSDAQTKSCFCPKCGEQL